MTRRRLLVVVILAIALAPLPAHPQATLGGEWRDDVERFAESLVEAQLVPGMESPSHRATGACTRERSGLRKKRTADRCPQPADLRESTARSQAVAWF
jgi:hypothetical protein